MLSVSNCHRIFDRDQRVSELRLKVSLFIAVFFLRQDTLLDIVSLHPVCINGYWRHTPGGYQVMD